MTQADLSAASNRIAPSRRWWLLAGLALGAIIVLLCLVVLIPAGVRALPGRYAARLPGFLQDLRRRPHPDVLPTPAIVITPPVPFTPTATALRLSGVTILTATPGEQGGMGAGEQGGVVAPTSPAAFQPTNSSLPQPSNTPTHTPVPSPSATPTPTPTRLPAHASLPPITHTYQTWNNCGPATLSMALGYVGRNETQADTAAFLKPDPEDKNVSPQEMAAYARALGLEATAHVGGDLTRLKRLIAAGFAVVVETWFIPEPGDQMGHYRLLVGYDDGARQFITQDSYNGPNVRVNYEALDELWRVFNRIYLVVYHPAQAEQLAAILGEDADDGVMYARALEVAQAEAAHPNAECVAYEDCADGAAFAWFNVGSSLTALGHHAEAAAAYDQARLLGLPWRMLWYQFGPYESYYSVDRYADVITLATVTLNTTDNLEESYYWRGLAYVAQGDTARARADFEAAIRYNPNFAAAAQALESLE
jgi:tetratricopeptide (TPR) repeat protein